MEILDNNKFSGTIFRNRLELIKKEVLEKKNLESIIMILSYDSLNNSNMNKFANWLLFGFSSVIELEEKALPQILNETFIIIEATKIFVFSSNKSKQILVQLFSKMKDTHVEFFFTTTKEESNTDKIQLLKISKFFQQTYRIKRVGLPLLKKEKNNVLEVEKWPLIQAYALDVLGEGFFTLSHEIIDISLDLEILYRRIDVTSIMNLHLTKANKLEITLSDFFGIFFDREPIEKRQNKSEYGLNESQELDFLLINYNSMKSSKFEYLSDLPEARVLVGCNTDKSYADTSSFDAIYKITFDHKLPSFHLTYENFDPVTGTRVGRTFFLSNLQKLYLDYNDSESLEYMPTRIYEDAFYLFNIYFKLVNFFRKNQFDLVGKSMERTKAKEKLLNEINNYINKEHKKSRESFDYFLKENNIFINLNEYNIQGKASSDEVNKISVLRIEIKEIVSALSNRRIGSVVYCDSFLITNGELFNLTQDIIPFKFINTTKIHLTGRDNYDYDPLKLLKINSNIIFSEIEAKGLAFYKNEYNIPYLFPDSSELGYDNNQMFNYLSGKLFLLEDYILFYDNSLGYIVLDSSNIKDISLKDEMKYTILLITLINSEQIPLSKIIKNELLIFIPSNNSKIKSIKYDVISFLKSKYSTRFKLLSNAKENEYDLAIRTITDNENDNLNYVSNSFNITNITDVILELFEFEYISMKYLKNNKLNFQRYKFIRESISNYEEKNEEDKKTKIVFLFCSQFDNVKKFSKFLFDLAKNYGSVKMIVPKLNLINDEKTFYEFYCKSILDFRSQKIKILLVIIYNEIKIKNFLYNLVSFYENSNLLEKKTFLKEFEILSVNYAINLKFFTKNKNKDLYERIFEASQEDLINFILIDEDCINKEKTEYRNNLISSMNSKAIIFNTRSFLKSKEVNKIFTEKNLLNPKKISFHFDFLMGDNNNNKKEEYFIKLKLKIKKDLLLDFLKNNLDQPLKYSREKLNSLSIEEKKQKSENSIENEIDSDRNNAHTDIIEQKFIDDLTEEVNLLKRSSNEPVIEKVFGYAKFIKDKANEDFLENQFYTVRGSYKEISIELFEEKTYNIAMEEIGLILSGFNLKSNIDYLTDLILSFSGEIPELKEFKTKDSLTEAEMRNLNSVNIRRDIPQGWRKEGAVFFDPDGNINYSHPYYDSFVEEYLLLSNSAVDEHNKRVKEKISSLII